MIIFDFIAHIFSSLFFGYCLDYFFLNFTFKETLFYYIFIILGSVLPDIDTPYSFLGKRIKPISKVLYKKIGHRSATHSVIIVTIAFFISIIVWEINTILVGLVIGSITHILTDLTTPQGVCIAYPVNKKRYKILK